MSSDSNIPLVPFGKYKGKPITELLADSKYLEWFKQQEFAKKYTTIYNICVNQTIGSHQPSKTPDHNRIQNLFLDSERVDKFYEYLYTRFPLPQILHKYRQCLINHIKEGLLVKPIFEGCYNWDIVIDGGCHDEIKCGDECYYNRYYGMPSIYVEIKPLVGDDYPSILRKIKTQIELTDMKLEKDKKNWLDKIWLERKFMERKLNGYIGQYYLLIKDYKSSTTTKEELIQIFNQSHIRVLFLNDIFHDLPLSFYPSSTDEKIESEKIQMTQPLLAPSSDEKIQDIVTQTTASPISPDDRIELLEKRIARLESLLKKMGIEDEQIQE